MYLLLISRFVLRKSSLTSSMLIRCIRTNDATTENAFFAIMNPCNLLNIVDRILGCSIIGTYTSDKHA